MSCVAFITNSQAIRRYWATAETCTPTHCRWRYIYKEARSMFELSTLADRDRLEELMRRFLISWNVRTVASRTWCQRSVNSRWLTIYDMHVYMNFRKHELLDTQNLLFLIVFSMLCKTPNATYLHHFILFSPALLSFVLSYQLLAATSNKYIFMFMLINFWVASCCLKIHIIEYKHVYTFNFNGLFKVPCVTWLPLKA